MQAVQAVLIDRGPGIADLEQVLDRRQPHSGLGIVGARKLVDQFSIDSGPESEVAATSATYQTLGDHSDNSTTQSRQVRPV
jgi:anti-sigma regulatory factor (Ser/Thr protein kinase)